MRQSVLHQTASCIRAVFPKCNPRRPNRRQGHPLFGRKSGGYRISGTACSRCLRRSPSSEAQKTEGESYMKLQCPMLVVIPHHFIVADRPGFPELLLHKLHKVRRGRHWTDFTIRRILTVISTKFAGFPPGHSSKISPIFTRNRPPALDHRQIVSAVRRKIPDIPHNVKAVFAHSRISPGRRPPRTVC